MEGVPSARQRAEAYLAGRPDAPEARLLAAMCGRASRDALADSLADATEASVTELRRRLGWLDDLGRLDSDAAGRLGARLAALQAEDGHWSDGEWALFETGMIAGHLAKSPRVRASVLGAAGEWLAERFDPDLVQGFQWRNIAAFAHTFANLPHEAADGVLQWCGRELERGFRARRFSALRTARVLLWCDAPVLPGARLAPEELVEALLGEQAADGGFGEGEESAARTWDAWLVLERLAGPA